MRCIVIYDISSDAVRGKVADICLDYGLDRVQLSAFIAELSMNRQEELMMRLKRQLGRAEGNIQLIPICDRDWVSRKVIHNARKPAGDGRTEE